MIPNKELLELAQALKRSAEYTEMMRLRRRVVGHPRYGRQALFFEREHARLYNMGLPEAEMALRIKKLYTDFRDLLQEEEVKRFVESTRIYQKLIMDCIAYLNRNLEVSRAY